MNSNYKHYLFIKNGELNIYIDDKDTNMVDFCTSNTIKRSNFLIFTNNTKKTQHKKQSDLKTYKDISDIND
jgi:hypothetical protein